MKTTCKNRIATIENVTVLEMMNIIEGLLLLIEESEMNDKKIRLIEKMIRELNVTIE